MSDTRIVVITNGNFFARLILDDLFECHGNQIAGVVCVGGDYKGRAKLESVYALSKVTAWPYIFYKVISVVFLKVLQTLNPGKSLDVASFTQKKGIPTRQFQTIKSADVINWIASLKPDLIVSVSCPQLIGRKILDTSRLGGINIHGSALPRYAGLAPYFWVLSNGEKETGITAHYMTQKFDQGNILSQSKVEIMPGESAFHLFWRLAVNGSRTLLQAVGKALQEDKGVQQDLEGYSYYSNPSLKAFFKLLKNKHTLFRFTEIVEAVQSVTQ